MSDFRSIRSGIAGRRTSHTPQAAPTDLNIQRGRPTEQGAPDGSPPFTGGGRVANHSVEGVTPPDRPQADADYTSNLQRTVRQNREDVGGPDAPLRKPHGPNT